MDTKVTPIWNAMAVIPGIIKDEVVVIGNHRDGESNITAQSNFIVKLSYTFIAWVRDRY